MDFSKKQVGDFGAALNEATLLGADVDPSARRAWLTFAVLALPEGDDPPPVDPRVRLILSPVGRIAASLRLGAWDDPDTPIEPLPVDELSEVVTSFNQQAIWGWEFLDVPDEHDFANWSERLSLEWRSEPGGLSHTLYVFQENGTERQLAVRFWFDELRIYQPDGHEVPLDDFTAAGVRWWDGMRAHDPRTTGHGIVPAAPWPDQA
jgi:hypothetical protein